MAKPNLSELRITIADVRYADTPDGFASARKQIHHALYYHNQGWSSLSSDDHRDCIHAIEHMHDVETAHLNDLFASDIYD